MPPTDRSPPPSERVDSYDYVVPPQAIAQEPKAARDGARLLVVPRQGPAPPGPLIDSRIADLPQRLFPGDLLVLNSARVAPARLAGRRRSGGAVTLLVLAAEGRQAQVLLGARGTLVPGEELDVAGDRWRLVRSLGEGRHAIEVVEGREVATLLAHVGRMPLPPYIRRGATDDPRDAGDRERYQTVYAEGPARAVAAPTAGLHFTAELLAAVQARGVRIERLQLHVGEGTFRPLRGEWLHEHVMHAEDYEIPESLAVAAAETRAAGGRLVAVGTTVVRALESAVEAGPRGAPRLRAGAGRSTLFLKPGHRFGAVDALLTNFHQPRSTLLVLVSAFAGADTIRRAYAHALAGAYRLFSYGDAMLLQRSEPG